MSEAAGAAGSSAGGALRRALVFAWQHKKLTFSLATLLALVAVALLADAIAPASPTRQNLGGRLLPPGAVARNGFTYWLGSDQFGRDLLSRLIHGVRTPLVIGFSAALIGGVVGLALGTLAGYFRRLDPVISYVVDVMLSLPFVIIAMAVVVLFGASATNIILVFALASWPTTARVARAMTWGLVAAPFVEALRTAGASHARILLRHIVPNVLPAAVVIASVQVSQFVIYESAFGFLGLGVPPPEPTWGNILADARNHIHAAWWMGVFPGLGIALVALAANLLGDALRDLLDPHDQARER
jgi:peptide/nickel transport system permease protein